MRKYFNIGIIFCLMSLLLLAGCKFAAKIGPGSPSSIAWNDTIYGYSGHEVSESELGSQLGEIIRIKKPIPEENGDSNDTPVGSIIYEIKGIDSKEAVAIEKDGKIYKVVKKDILRK